MSILSLIAWILMGIIYVLDLVIQKGINKKHSTQIKNLKDELELLKLSREDHYTLIKHLLDKEKDEKQGPKVDLSPDLWNEVKRNEKL